MEPIAFLSYAHFDDEYEENKITDFCERLAAALRMISGRQFPIFRDKKDIQWGQRWRDRIEQGIDSSVFLIAVVTPSYFQSEYCRKEYDQFLKREQQLGRRDLILPVYYVDCDEFDEEPLRDSNLWAKDLYERQYADWRSLRWESSPNVVGRAVERLARQIKQALKIINKPGAKRLEEASQSAAATAESGKTSVPKSKPAEELQEPHASSNRRQEPPTHIVDAMHRGDFTTISAAITAARPGDRIAIRPGLYREGLVIDKPLEIIGDGKLGDIALEANGKDVILFKASMGIVRNLILRQTGGGEWYAVDITQGRLVLENCDITSQSLACIAIHGNADPQILRNRLHDGKTGGIYVYETGQGTIEDNDIFGNAYAGMEISEGGNPLVRRNRINKNAYQAIWVYNKGSGTFEDNDLRDNARGAWNIEQGCEVKRERNREE